MVATLNTTCWQGILVSCHTCPPFFEIGQQILMIWQLRYHLHLILTEQKKKKSYASDSLMPVASSSWPTKGTVSKPSIIFWHWVLLSCRDTFEISFEHLRRNHHHRDHIPGGHRCMPHIFDTRVPGRRSNSYFSGKKSQMAEGTYPCPFVHAPKTNKCRRCSTVFM